MVVLLFLLISPTMPAFSATQGSTGEYFSKGVFQPNFESWTLTGSLYTPRYNHIATLLPDERILVAGGYRAPNFLDTAVIYDPASGTWTATTPMAVSRGGHTATLLPNG